MIVDNKYTGIGNNPINPLQEEIYKFKDSYDNLIVSAPTSSGKSMTVSMVGSKYIENNEAIIYIGSYKTLVEEKNQDAGKDLHPWKDINQVVITGDYTYTDELAKQCEDALYITMTPESLVSKVRNANNEKNSWIKKVKAVFVDEVHLISDEERGMNIEAALMKLVQIVPNVQIVAMSASIPNAEDLKNWFTTLNGKKTDLILSDYRPVELEWLFYPYREYRQTSEDVRIDLIRDIIRTYPKSQFLVGVFKTTFGDKIKKFLEDKEGHSVDFHNSRIPMPKRKQMIERFKTKSLNILVATCGYFTGVNSPAEHVIITSHKAGGQDISATELQQLGGRAGRTGYYDKGYVHMLVADTDLELVKERILKGTPVISQLRYPSKIATHFLGAMYMGTVRSTDEFLVWYKKSLAYQQMNLLDNEIESLLTRIMKDMTIRRMVYSTNNGIIYLTPKGRISAQMLVDPYLLSDITFNLSKYLKLNLPSDIDAAKVLGECDEFSVNWFSWQTENEIPIRIKQTTSKEHWCATAAVYHRLRCDEIPYNLVSVWSSMYEDVERLSAAMVRVDKECEKWGAEEEIAILFTRIKKSLPYEKAKIFVNGFSQYDMKALDRAGIQTLDEIKGNIEEAKMVLSKKGKAWKTKALDRL